MAKPGKPGGRVSAPPRPVLVVDSDPAIRRILSLVLEGAGVPCLTCATAEDALPLVRKHRPKLVLSEVRLGDRSGPELARTLAHNGDWRPQFALMSAYPRPRKGYEDYFLNKPIEFDRLIQLVESVEREAAS